MDIQTIVKELKRERDRLNKAIAALEETQPAATQASRPAATAPVLPPKKNNRGDRLTPEGRKRLSDAMTKRWAAKKKKTPSAASKLASHR